MRAFKKVIALAVIVCMFSFVMVGCNNDDNGTDKEGTKEIYLLNFKPEIEEQYKEVIKKYEAETGVKLKVVTAAAGTYEQTLLAEMEKSDKPAIFNINGPVGYESWKDYCLNLKDSEIYKHLSNQALAVSSGDGVYGVPATVEGYGIIYNKTIMNKYFASDKKTTDVDSMEKINNFATLKAVVEDMTKLKADLDIEGVFASTSLKSGEDWRWQTHLMNMPLYYEFGKEGTVVKSTNAKEISFSSADKFKNLFDLYLNNSITEKNMLGSKAVADSMAEFALGKVAMVQNGFWAWGDIEKEGKINADEVAFLPLYTGESGEETQGICIGTENFFCVNSKVDADTQKLALDFLYWLVSDADGKKLAIEQLSFNLPYDTVTEADQPSNPLTKDMLAWSSKEGITSVEWAFLGMPSQNWKNNLGANLLLYAQGQKSWDDLKTATVNDWKTERP